MNPEPMTATLVRCMSRVESGGVRKDGASRAAEHVPAVAEQQDAERPLAGAAAEPLRADGDHARVRAVRSATLVPRAAQARRY
jgi:hypothetical protein